jgi:hypothetical protein
MDAFRLDIPVVLLCFNRPEPTRHVMEAIRQARPPRLYVVADAPRPSRPSEAEHCAEVRRIATTVDWPCEVLTAFAQENMGCRLRVSSGLTWAFAQSPELIILEDDCVPHPEFFRFCQEMLERHRHDERIFAISGDNFHRRNTRNGASYHFSRIFHCWGWASWDRAWKTVDLDMTEWPAIRDGGWLTDQLFNPIGVKHFHEVFEKTRRGKNSSWAYRAMLSSMAGNRMTIRPNVNMVTNIGQGADATHTQDIGVFGDIPAEGATFPLLHPPHQIPDSQADARTMKLYHWTLGRRVRAKLGRAWRKLAG